MLKIIFDNENVYVSYGAGEWEVQPLNNSWLQLIGAIHDGKRIKITDDRKERQEHQYDLTCKRGISETNHLMLRKLLDVYHPETRGFMSFDEQELVRKKLQFEDRTVIELRNLRDFVVLSMSRFDDMKDWDRMSAITHCIDMELVERGEEV